MREIKHAGRRRRERIRVAAKAKGRRGCRRPSPIKTLVMMGAGFVLASVGLDIVTGQPRLTFGSITLLSGFNFVPVTIGLFGIGEILAAAEEKDAGQRAIRSQVGIGDLVEAVREHGRRVWLFIGSTLMGFWVGVMPGTGATPASFMGYGMARQYSKHPERFGTGAARPVWVLTRD